MTLPYVAQVAGYVTAILVAVGLVVRLVVSVPIVKAFFAWIREGRAEDRAERLDRMLAFNGTGSFRADMRVFYKDVHTHMIQADRDRVSVREALGKQQKVEVAGSAHVDRVLDGIHDLVNSRLTEALERIDALAVSLDAERGNSGTALPVE